MNKKTILSPKEVCEKMSKEISKIYDSYYRSSDTHCDTWFAFGFKISENGKFFTYVVKRTYENYDAGDDCYNKIVIHNLEIEKQKETGMNKYEWMGPRNTPYLKEDIAIDSIVNISNKGEVTYLTLDEKKRTFSF